VHGRRNYFAKRARHAALAPETQRTLYATLVAQLPQLERALVGRDAILAVLDWLPEECDADATRVAQLLGWPEPEVAGLLDDLEAAGDLTSAVGRASRQARMDDWWTGEERAWTHPPQPSPRRGTQPRADRSSC
jgi:hypothetical protein